MKISNRQKISSVLWGKIFAFCNSGYTTEFCYGVEKSGSVNHLEFYGVENFRCNRTNGASSFFMRKKLCFSFVFT